MRCVEIYSGYQLFLSALSEHNIFEHQVLVCDLTNITKFYI